MSLFGIIVLFSITSYIGAIFYLIKYRREMKMGDSEKNGFRRIIILFILCLTAAMLQYIYFKPIGFIDEGAVIRTLRIEYHNADDVVTDYIYNESSDLTEFSDTMSKWRGRRNLVNFTRSEEIQNLAIVGIVIETNEGFEDFAIFVEENNIVVSSGRRVYTILDNDNGTLSAEALRIMDGYVLE